VGKRKYRVVAYIGLEHSRPDRRWREMSEMTRRAFIKRVSIGVAGVATMGAIETAPPAKAAPFAPASAHLPLAAEELPSAASDPIVAYVRDPRRGEVSVLVGHREVVHRDPELVRRLLHAAK
jgi:hypothetical protein